MSLQAVGGSRLYIGRRLPYKSIITLADFTGVTWTEISGWTQAGDIGAEQETLTQTLISQNSTLYAKGPISFPIMANTVVPMTADAGQVLFKAAQLSCHPYAFKIEWGADCGEESIVTISSATPGVIGWVGHGQAVNTPIVFMTTGSLPTGLVAGTTYYVKTVMTADTFTVSATPGGTVINTTTAGTGVHTAYMQPIGETDLMIGLAMLGTKTGGAANANRFLNFPVQPIASSITV